MGFVEDMKWWHWVLVSLLLGACLGYMNDNVDAPIKARTMEAQTFEKLVMTKPIEDHGTKYPWITNIMVYPPVFSKDTNTDLQMATFWVLPQKPDADGGRRYQECVTLAPVPYVPGGPKGWGIGRDTKWPGMKIYLGKPGDTINSVSKTVYGEDTPSNRQAIVFANPRLTQAKSAQDWVIRPGTYYLIPWGPNQGHTLRDFIHDASQSNDWIRYKYAWWHEHRLVYPIWMGGSLLVIGIIWPMLIRVLTAGGLGRAKATDDYDLDRFKGGQESKPALMPVGMTSADEKKMKDLEDSLLESLKGSDVFKKSANADQKASAGVKKLNAGPVDVKEPVKVAQQDDKKTFRGEYYPVAKSGDKKA